MTTAFAPSRQTTAATTTAPAPGRPTTSPTTTAPAPGRPTTSPTTTTFAPGRPASGPTTGPAAGPGATTATRPTVGAAAAPQLRRPVAGAAPARPRLLLPPLAQPPTPPLVSALAACSPPVMHSVLSPVTDGPWQIAPPHRRRAPEPLPDPTRLCGSLVLAAVQALTGGRPLIQLTRWVTSEVFDALAARVATPVTAPGPARSAVVRRTLLARIGPTVAEATVVVHDGERVRAAALRMEVHRDHWRATVLQIG